MSAAAARTAPVKRAPQQQRALDRIQAILAATEALLAENGYDGLTMVGIAARAGITHTSIYHYFQSVDAILAALVARIMDDFDREVDARLAQAETLQELVEALLDSVAVGFEIYRSNPVSRGLWAATRYLPALRKLDYEDTARNSQLFSERFIALAPQADPEAIHALTLLAASLGVPAYEAALSLDESMQDVALENFLAMIRARYGVLLQLDITA
jgi:AcrR family transcriptional regulator